jgi:hypothetical protein
MTASETVTLTGRKRALDERPNSTNVAAVAPVLVAVWCRSVGTSWTLELHRLDGGTASGTIVDWITSGVPISQPEPQTLTRELLVERGLHLFQDPSVDPRTQNRHRIGYACTNAELIKLAHLVRDDSPKAGMHPITLATHWIAAGFSANAAVRWIRQGAHSPPTAQQQTPPSEVTVSQTHKHQQPTPSRLRTARAGSEAQQHPAINTALAIADADPLTDQSESDS